jgi:hypothetical protein
MYYMNKLVYLLFIILTFFIYSASDAALLNAQYISDKELISVANRDSDSFDSIESYTQIENSIPGNGNGDNAVDYLDYIIWLINFGSSTTGGSSKGDYNNDGFVDGSDYIMWHNYFGQGGSTGTPTPTPVINDKTAIWWGDADTNGMDAWDGIQCPAGSTTIVNDPEGKYGKVYHTYLGPGDTYGGTGRCEFWGTLLPNGEKFNYKNGDDYYFGWRTRVSNGVYTTGGNSGNFLQLKGDSTCGGPAVGITMYGGKLTLRTELYGVFWYGPAMTSFTGSWHDIILRVRFSKDASVGFVEAWLDGAEITF